MSLHGVSRHKSRLMVGGMMLAAAVFASGQGPATQYRDGRAAAATLSPVKKATIPHPFVNGHAGSYAWGAATMPDGTVIIGDIWNRRVIRYDTSGNELGVLIQLKGGDAPYGLAVDPRNSTIYIGRQFAQGPEVWALSGGVYTMTGLLHRAGMQYPSRVAVANDGTVYVTDELSSMVYVFNGDTRQFEFSFGGHGTGSGQFIQPRGIALDGSSPQRVFVMDCGNERVQVFDLSGNFLYSFGSKGTGHGQFDGVNTRGLAIDKTNGLLFVVDDSEENVHELTLTGTWVRDIGHVNRTVFPSPPGTFTDGGREATIDGAGQLWVGDMPNYRAQVFNTSTGKILFVTPNPAQLPANGGFNAPRGVAVDSAGNLYVADTHNFRIEKFSPTGAFVWAVGNRGGTLNPDSFAYSRNMAGDPTEPYFYVADTYNNAVDKYDSNGNLIWQINGRSTGSIAFGFPSGVAVAPNHDLYVADSRNHRIVVFEPTAGGLVSMFSCTPHCGDPRGVAIDAATGNIYIADQAPPALYEYSPTGAYIATIATKGTNPGQLKSASDVVVDSTYIYLTDTVGQSVDIYNLADGSFNTAISTMQHGPSAAAINPVTGYLDIAEEFADVVTSYCISTC
jgi:tripartite motif-containing protein 71